MTDRYDRSAPVWVIVRVDLFQLRDGVPDDPEVFVTVKEVVETEEQAKAEVTSVRMDRLSGVSVSACLQRRGQLIGVGS
jgi:hypothetical protein